MNKFIPWKSKNPDSWFSCRPGLNGFLPVGEPMEKLPEKYNIINDLLDEMRITKKDSTPGLLANLKFGEEIEKKLPFFDFEDITDKKLLACLYRDYCFLASAYSLEPAHYNLKDGIYGKARDKLPKNIALPLFILSEKVEGLPWLDYAYGYGLNNAVLKDESLDKGDYKSYRTIRMFNGIESESGFINVHVAMVSYSGELLDYQQKILESASYGRYNELEEYLNLHYFTLNKILESLQTMWKACKKSEYLSFRTFIMGQKGNEKMYPNGYISYEIDNDELKYTFRGETGAQDSLIPSIDNLFQIKYPRNKLTEYLYDLRLYRPIDHQEYIDYNFIMSKKLDLINFIKKDPQCSLALLKNLNAIRLFRRKHWNLTKMYIIKNTKHPVATGGTPITTWLPNQLGATMETMMDIVNAIDVNKELLTNDKYNEFLTIKLELNDHLQKLMDEVSKLQDDFKNQEHKSFLVR